MIYQIGRLGRVLVAEEATYGVTPALLATHAVRHRNVGFDYSPFNRVNSEEKRGTRGVSARFDRRTTAGLAPLEAYLRPSGTIGTIPEMHLLLKHLFGDAVVGTLDTTATGVGSTATTFALTAVAGLAVGEFVSVRRVANGNVPEVRRVTAIAGSDITVSPALGGAPAAGDTVKAGVTYKLLTNLTKSLSVAHYLPDLHRIARGVVLNQGTFTFNNNEEAMCSFSGPAMDLMPRGDVPVFPGFTTVGSQNPPSGLTGGAFIGDTEIPCLINAEIVLLNNLNLLNECFGTRKASDWIEDGFRDTTFTIETPVSDDFTIYDLAEAGTAFAFFLQCGETEGNIVAVHMPACELNDVPNFGDDNGRNNYSHAGVAKEASAAGNDEIAVGLC